jgi:IS30 family transposase
MPRGGQNRLPVRVKQSYFELIRTGMPGAEAARRVGVSMSCGSLWFIDAGSVSITETRPINSRYIDQDDRIEIADGLAAGEPVKSIAARIGKSFQSTYREIARNRKPDGTYQPWFAHNQAHLRRRRPKRRILSQQTSLAAIIAGKLAKRWSPEQISRWLRRRYPRRLAWHVCAETIYDAIYRQLIVAVCVATLRTGRTYRHERGRGRTKDGTLKQCTAMKSIHDRPAAVETRLQAGHWEGDLIIGAGQRSAIATLVERKTRVTKLVRLPDNHSAQSVANALIAEFSCLPASLCRTLTWDQGNEMFQHAVSRKRPDCGSTSPTHTHPGSEAPTRTSMGCSANTSPKDQTCIIGPASTPPGGRGTQRPTQKDARRPHAISTHETITPQRTNQTNSHRPPKSAFRSKAVPPTRSSPRSPRR